MKKRSKKIERFQARRNVREGIRNQSKWRERKS